MKRRFRFGLRSLLALMVFASFVCGFYAFNAKHYAAIDALMKGGHHVEWKRDSPSWLDEALGIYRFDSVKRVEYNTPVGDMGPIGDLHSLEEFRSDYMLRDFSQLMPHADTLRVFSMFDCPTEASDFLSKTRNLEEFCGNTWSGFDLTWLAGNRNLKVLYLTNSTGLEHLGKFKQLEYLNAPHELDTLEPLRNMTKLEQLDFAGSRVTSLEPIRHLKSLKSIYFEEVSIPQPVIDDFLKSLPSDVKACGSAYFPEQKAEGR